MMLSNPRVRIRVVCRCICLTNCRLLAIVALGLFGVAASGRESSNKGEYRMVERPGQGDEASTETVGGIRTTFSTGELVYASVIAFLAWVVCVYDYIMFGTLLPKMAGDFGWSPA